MASAEKLIRRRSDKGSLEVLRVQLAQREGSRAESRPGVRHCGVPWQTFGVCTPP